MLSVLFLAGIEKVVNVALAIDPITQAGLALLAGKTMRLVLKEPSIQLDILFNDDHIRLEPVTISVFEPKGTDIVIKPDCTVTADNPAHLLRLVGETEGNLPIEGDYKFLMQVKTIMAGFDPDIIGKLQPMIGLPLASQLTQLFSGLKKTVSHPAKSMFVDMADMSSTHWYDNRDELKQELLKLRADIDREQARLDAIKAEQATLTAVKF